VSAWQTSAWRRELRAPKEKGGNRLSTKGAYKRGGEKAQRVASHLRKRLSFVKVHRAFKELSEKPHWEKAAMYFNWCTIKSQVRKEGQRLERDCSRSASGGNDTNHDNLPEEQTHGSLGPGFFSKVGGNSNNTNSQEKKKNWSSKDVSALLLGKTLAILPR